MKNKKLSLKLAVLLLACGSFGVISNSTNSFPVYAMENGKDKDPFYGVDFTSKGKQKGYGDRALNLRRFHLGEIRVSDEEIKKVMYELDVKYGIYKLCEEVDEIRKLLSKPYHDLNKVLEKAETDDKLVDSLEACENYIRNNFSSGVGPLIKQKTEECFENIINVVNKLKDEVNQKYKAAVEGNVNQLNEFNTIIGNVLSKERCEELRSELNRFFDELNIDDRRRFFSFQEGLRGNRDLTLSDIFDFYDNFVKFSEENEENIAYKVFLLKLGNIFRRFPEVVEQYKKFKELSAGVEERKRVIKEFLKYRAAVLSQIKRLAEEFFHTSEKGFRVYDIFKKFSVSKGYSLYFLEYYGEAFGLGENKAGNTSKIRNLVDLVCRVGRLNISSKDKSERKQLYKDITDCYREILNIMSLINGVDSLDISEEAIVIEVLESNCGLEEKVLKILDMLKTEDPYLDYYKHIYKSSMLNENYNATLDGRAGELLEKAQNYSVPNDKFNFFREFFQENRHFSDISEEIEGLIIDGRFNIKEVREKENDFKEKNRIEKQNRFKEVRDENQRLNDLFLKHEENNNNKKDYYSSKRPRIPGEDKQSIFIDYINSEYDYYKYLKSSGRSEKEFSREDFRKYKEHKEKLKEKPKEDFMKYDGKIDERGEYFKGKENFVNKIVKEEEDRIREEEERLEEEGERLEEERIREEKERERRNEERRDLGLRYDQSDSEKEDSLDSEEEREKEEREKREKQEREKQEREKEEREKREKEEREKVFPRVIAAATPEQLRSFRRFVEKQGDFEYMKDDVDFAKVNYSKYIDKYYDQIINYGYDSILKENLELPDYSGVLNATPEQLSSFRAFVERQSDFKPTEYVKNMENPLFAKWNYFKYKDRYHEYLKNKK